MLTKQKSLSLPRNLVLGTFWEIVTSILNKGKSATSSLFSDRKVLFSESGKAILGLWKTFLGTIILMTQLSLFLFSLLELI